MNRISHKSPRDPWPRLYWGLFFVVVPLVALWMRTQPGPQVTLPMPARNLPAYHLITATDVMTVSIPLPQTGNDVIRDLSELTGRYTLQSLTAGKPVLQSQVAAVPDPTLITNTIAVAISANSTNTLGGALRAGDVVLLAAVPHSDTAMPPTTVLDAVLVLDVKQVQNEGIVVLAIPAERWSDYLSRAHNALFVLARRVK